MGFDVPKEKFGGRIKEVAIGATKEDGGTRRAKLIAGGRTAFPSIDSRGSRDACP